MAIDQITYRIAQEGGIATDDNKSFTRTSRLTFQASSNSPYSDDVNTIGNDFAAPKIGGPHPFIPMMWSTHVNCRKVSQVMYEFDVDYLGKGKDNKSPLDEDPIIETDFAISEEPYDVDYEGTPILFKTGEAPDPPIKDTWYDLVIRISRNLQKVDYALLAKYAGAVNSDPFLGLPPGTCKITEPPKTRSATWDTLTYYQCSMGITVRRGIPGLFEDSEAWYKRTLAQGFYVREFLPGANTGNKTRVVHARDSSGEKVTKPILHSTHEGFKIPFDPDTGMQDPKKAEWYKFKPAKPPLPFSELRIA